MWNQLRPALLMLVVLSLLTGVFYPLVVTAVAYVVFPRAAHGSIVMQGSKAVGSDLIGQSFSDPRYFWGRPSATGPVPYNAMAGSGSNQATTNPALVEAVKARIAILRSADPANNEPVPIDLVTASSSGLDPHISPAAALYQVNRVSIARQLSAETVKSLVSRHIEGRTLGIFGQPRVHVLKLNLALDELDQQQSATSE